MSEAVDTMENLRSILLDCQQPVAKRTEAAFRLRTLNTLPAAQALCSALRDVKQGSLMRHELAYILGQMQREEVSQVLEDILATEDEDILVRHESAEALGAIGSEKYLSLLERYKEHNAPEISETCQIAIDLIKYKNSCCDSEKKISIYASIDPAPPVSEAKSLQEYREIYLDKELPLFDRYRAMFSLRDINTDDSANALVEGFQDDSALFRHEVAYVLGQMQRSCAAPALANVLRNMKEHRMVRHEAAEALGSIGGEIATSALREFHEDAEPVVQESCEVALNIVDYWAEPPH